MRCFSVIRCLRKRALTRARGFTLVELLVAITVLVLLLGLLVAITGMVSKTVLYTSSKIDAFSSGRTGFDLMSQKLSQATLNTYWDYDNPVTPSHYYRQSDLQFLVRQNVQKSGYGQEVYFASPSAYSANPALRSTDGLLNACGFFVAYGPDTSFRPGTMTSAVHYRYRLIQGLEPMENLATYANWPAPPASTATYALWNQYWSGVNSTTPATTTTWASSVSGTWANYWATHAWINNTIGNPGSGSLNTNDTPVAANVIALIVWPHLNAVDDATGNELTANYTYDSQHQAMAVSTTTNVQPLTANQLPPTIQITMILISEASAVQTCTSSTPPTAIETALSGKFTVSTYTQYQADINAVGASLAASHITYEVLNTTVTMKESKWSDYSQ